MIQAENRPRQLAFSALLDACRLWLGSDTVGALIDKRLNWDLFERFAFVHNLEPLLHHLRAEGLLLRRDIPASLCDRWEKAYFENFVFNTRALEIIQPFCDACERLGLPIAFIKGPVISARVFADPALRIMVDLDILGREQDLPELVRLARQAGFTGGEETAVYHLSLRHQELALLLELHFKMYEFLPDSTELLDNLLRTAEPCRHGNFVFPAPPPHVETAIEVAHLINHDLRVNLKPLLDLAGGLRTIPSATLLKQTIAAWDLEPEAMIIGQVLERLFNIHTGLGRTTASPQDNRDVDALVRGIESAETRARPALEELAARPGVSAKLDYLWRLLLSSPRRLEAISDDAKESRGSARLAHLGHTFSRGWAKLTHAGIASGSDFSIKRELFRRRAR